MKLTHLALFMTVALLGLTSWLAWQSHNDVTGLRNQLELARLQAKAAQHVEEPPPAPQEINVPSPAEAAPLPLESQVSATKFTPGLPPQTADLPPPVTAPVARPHVNMDTSSLPPPMSPRQRQVLAMPSIARVKEYHAENGFILINAGKNKKLENGMSFALRRGNGIVGRIKIGASEDAEAIGDLIPRSVPPGVTIEIGDEVIQDLSPES
jgi:hypothetical protein